MRPTRFCRYELRTKDVEGARAFYTELLGPAFWTDPIGLVPLPERAAARGAPSHWLGHLGVDDVEDTLQRFVAKGAEQLGPLVTAADGKGKQATLRDPSGAVLALSSGFSAPNREPVAWHILHARDHAAAFAPYAELFGWRLLENVDLGAALGRHQRFTWNDSGEPVGSASDTANDPRIHAQWMFFFPVDDLVGRLTLVRQRGGIAFDPIALPNGDQVAPCDDPQGGAFALIQKR